MNEYVQQAVALTKQLIEAATPIAKQAYEIGLLTLQIDAAAVLIPFLIGFIIFSVITYKYGKAIIDREKLIKDWCEERANAEQERKNKGEPPKNPSYRGIYMLEPDDWKRYCPHEKPGDGAPICLVILAMCVIGCAMPLVQVWQWVKLFAPELWLAHQAIEKLLSVAK